MVNVMIYEDSVEDLIERYVSLISNHNVFVWIKEFSQSRLCDFYKESIAKAGFRAENVKEDVECDWFANPPQAEVYFIDGLKNKCFDLLSKLPANRTYLNTDNEHLQAEARKQGFQVLEGGLEEAIQKATSN